MTDISHVYTRTDMTASCDYVIAEQVAAHVKSGYIHTHQDRIIHQVGMFNLKQPEESLCVLSGVCMF